MTTIRAESPTVETLFDRVPRVYAFVREHLFRDDTDRIVESLWPASPPPAGATMGALGGGPGLYARGLGARLRHVEVAGLDRSPAQLAEARGRARREGLRNCRFELGDVTRMPFGDRSVDSLIASRLLVILEEPERAVGEMHRVLRPGGRAFIAEPSSALRARSTLALLRLADELRRRRAREPAPRPGDRVAVLDSTQFLAVLDSQPWRRMHTWNDAGYRYAVVQKADA